MLERLLVLLVEREDSEGIERMDELKLVVILRWVELILLMRVLKGVLIILFIFFFRLVSVGREELRVIRLFLNVVGMVIFCKNDSVGMENLGIEMFKLISVVIFCIYDELYF